MKTQTLLKSIFVVVFIAVLLFIAPCNAANNPSALDAKVKKGSFTDSRDGKSYKTVKTDNQTWMAENLNYNASGSNVTTTKKATAKNTDGFMIGTWQ